MKHVFKLRFHRCNAGGDLQIIPTRYAAMCVLLVACLAVTGAAPHESSSDYDLTWHTIDGGGGTSTGGAYELSGTIGQPDAGVMSGGDYSLAGGFWAGGGDVEPKCPVFADLNCDGVVDVSDLLILLGAWGPCPMDQPCPADLNGDGTVDVSDLLILLANWG